MEIIFKKISRDTKLIVTYFFIASIQFLLSISVLYPNNNSEDPYKIKAFFGPSPAGVEDSPYTILTNQLMSARSSIYLAVYGFNLSHLTDLMILKKQQNLIVEMVIEKDSLENPVTHSLVEKLRENKVRVYLDQRNNGLMHNKFIVLDRKKVLTGSANFTLNGYFHHYNDVLLIEHPTIAHLYLRQFLTLSDPYFKRNKNHFRFAQNDFYLVDRVFHEVEQVKIVFSRSGENILAELIRFVHQAEETLDFMIFSFSSFEIANAMIQLIKPVDKSVRPINRPKIRGIFDDSFESENVTKNWRYLPFQTLWLAGADVKYDDERNKIHHKHIQIDQKYVLTGSFNFSKNAYRKNDENLVLIKSKRIAQKYQKRFQKLWHRFPDQTDFEKYIKKRRKEKLKLSYGDYLNQIYRADHNEIEKKWRKKYFKAKVERVFSGDELELSFKREKRRVKKVVRLFGIKAPSHGIRELNQEPQASRSQEILSLISIQKPVWVETITSNVFSPEVILFHENQDYLNRDFTHSVNHYMLSQGAAYLNSTSFRRARTEFYLKKKIVRKIDQAEQTAKRAWREAVKKKRFLFGKDYLLKPPAVFEAELGTYLVKKALIERKWRLVKYQKGAIMGNQKTQKAYLPSSSYYQDQLRDLTNPKLVFFKDVSHALKAGYKVVRGE